MEATLGKANCIVLTPKPEQIDTELQQLLEARKWLVRQTNVPLLAMADLCLLDRTQASRSAWGLPHNEGVVLIIVDADHLPELQTMLLAINRYVPIVSIWSFDNGILQCVRESGEDNQEADDSEQVSELQAMPANWYSNDEEPEIDSDDEDDEVVDSHISGDELAMLLDIEDQEKES